jgi:hypothetical protein
MVSSKVLSTTAIAAVIVISACAGEGSPPTGPSTSATISANSNGASPSFSTSSSRRGELHLIKECPAYTGEAGSYCTITKSNLKEVPAGTKVVYEKALVDGRLLDTDIRLETPGPDNDVAFGHVKIDLASPPGLVTLTGGTGKFAGFHATIDVTARRKPAGSWSWDGRFSFSERFVTGLQRARGSTVGPDGALYVTEAAAGRISRVDLETGKVSTFASGLPIPPTAFAGSGGVVDVAFLGRTAYALVTLVDPNPLAPVVGGRSAVGIYRVDGKERFTQIANIGTFSAARVPIGFFVAVPTGVQYALETFRGGFLVTDGNHNRVLQVSRDGEITQLIQFGNVVPTGLAVSGKTVYIAVAGPAPHLPETGKVVAFSPKSPTATDVAAGARMLVDVEFARGRTLFALSQGVWNGVAPGSPALLNTGSLVRVNGDGTFTVITGGLDRPTSLEIIGNTAYVVTLGGEIWTIEDIAGRRFGERDR